MILGHMIQGDWIEPNGATAMEISVYFELLRLWDSRAVWWKMEADQSALNGNIVFAQTRHAQVMFTLGEPPISALEAGYSKVPTMKALGSFVRTALADARGRIQFWEGWNEPMYPQYWDGTMQQLVERQKLYYQLIKAAQPSAFVLSPSFVRVELPDGQAFLRQYADVGGLLWCDGVAWHGYCAQPTDLTGQISSIKAVVGGKPLYNTEYTVGQIFTRKPVIDSLVLMQQAGVKVAVYNPEIPGHNDYTSDVMYEARKVLDTLPVIAKHKGCFR